MAVREYGDQIVFLRQIVPGAADKSYGIHVAKLAGLPMEVITRAQEILVNLEENAIGEAGLPAIMLAKEAPGKYTVKKKPPTRKQRIAAGEDPDDSPLQLSLFD